jgi:hypothetical protein
VPVQLLDKTNVKIASLIALNIIGLLISPFILRSNLYGSTMFLYLKYLFLLKIQFLLMIPLLNLDLFISMDTSIITFLQNWPKAFRI